MQALTDIQIRPAGLFAEVHLLQARVRSDFAPQYPAVCGTAQRRRYGRLSVVNGLSHALLRSVSGGPHTFGKKKPLWKETASFHRGYGKGEYRLTLGPTYPGTLRRDSYKSSFPLWDVMRTGPSRMSGFQRPAKDDDMRRANLGKNRTGNTPQ